ncbi:MAG: hypothetical protein KDD55_01240 [Bdellovibrionales bacterium]|nr:hypothetical protein [Bdellovibrionales bacterium]
MVRFSFIFIFLLFLQSPLLLLADESEEGAPMPELKCGESIAQTYHTEVTSEGYSRGEYGTESSARSIALSNCKYHLHYKAKESAGNLPCDSSECFWGKDCSKERNSFLLGFQGSEQDAKCEKVKARSRGTGSGLGDVLMVFSGAAFVSRYDYKCTVSCSADVTIYDICGSCKFFPGCDEEINHNPWITEDGTLEIDSSEVSLSQRCDAQQGEREG